MISKKKSHFGSPTKATDRGSAYTSYGSEDLSKAQVTLLHCSVIKGYSLKLFFSRTREVDDFMNLQCSLSWKKIIPEELSFHLGEQHFCLQHTVSKEEK